MLSRHFFLEGTWTVQQGCSLQGHRSNKRLCMLHQSGLNSPNPQHLSIALPAYGPGRAGTCRSHIDT